MKAQTWAFIDFENTGSLKDIKLKEYKRVYIFAGAKQAHLPLDELSNRSFTEIFVFKADTVSKNNVDFHLCYYLGKLDHSASNNTDFIVISNDKGYDNLIKHISNNGRKCSRTGYEASTKANKNNPCEVKIQEVINNILGNGLSQVPRTEQKLKNHIKSHLGKYATTNHINHIYNRLMKNEAIKNRMKEHAEMTI